MNKTQKEQSEENGSHARVIQMSDLDLAELTKNRQNIFGLSPAPIQSVGTGNGSPLSTPISTEVEEEQSVLVMDEKTWERVNSRRCDLIRRKYTKELTSTEQAELDALEEAATKYLNTVAPLPSYPLDALQAHVDRVKMKQKNGS